MSLHSDELGALVEKYRGETTQARLELQDSKKSFDTQVSTEYGTLTGIRLRLEPGY